MRKVKDFIWMLKTPIAHRGLHNIANGIPENSMAAFRAAKDKDYAIEIDVHLLADGKVAIHHDWSLKRLCSKDVDIRTLTASQLEDCRLAGTEEKIPLLSDLLTLLDGKVGLLVEFKNNTPFKTDLEEATIELLKSYNGPVALQSFNPFSVKYCRKNSDLPCGQLITWRKGGKRSEAMSFMGKLKICSISKPDFIAYDIHDLDDNPYVDKYMTKKKKPFITWTVRTPEQVAIAKKKHVNVIFEGFEFAPRKSATQPAPAQPTPPQSTPANSD